MRAIHAGVFGVLCRWPRLRDWLNYYGDTIALAEAGEPGSLRALEIRPVTEYGLIFQPSELRDILKCSAAEMDLLTVRFITGRLRDAVILGSSGVTIDGRSGRVVALATVSDGVPRNWRIARPLRVVEGDPSATYLNLLGVRMGHRHFAHFFTDTLLPLMVWLKNRPDGDTNVICLVREDLSAVQRDAFRFLARDFPGLAFHPLPANCRMVCQNAIFASLTSPGFGRDNLLLKPDLAEIRELFLKHYGIAPPARRTRIYVSRGDAIIRKVRNEATLKRLLARYGFESYEMGRLPFARQVELFASAEAVVAPHGAGLASLMFCAPGTQVLEIFSADYIIDWYAILSRTMGLDYHFLIAGRGDVWRKHFSIDPAALERAVIAMLDGSRLDAEAPQPRFQLEIIDAEGMKQVE